MTQPRYLTLALATLLVAALLWGIALPQLLPARDSNWIGGMYALKEAKADAAKGPKLALVSGSSGLFGLGAERLEAGVGMPVVNFSTHAGLGIKYLLNRAKRALRPGDTVLLALEYELLHPQRAPGRTLSNFVSAKDLAYVAAAPLNWFPYFFTGHDYKTLVWALIERLGLWRYKQACYGSARTLNRYGDETCANTDTFKTVNPGLLMAQGAVTADTVAPPAFDPAIVGFLAWARNEGVKVVIGFPPLFEKPVYAGAAHKKAFAELDRRYASFGVPVLGRPADFFYPANYMYDTRYHLHSKGREVHTGRILKLICEKAIACKK
jgi:hypothetical protein